MNVDDLLEEVTTGVHTKRIARHAAKMVLARRKRALLTVPVLVGTAVGVAGAWWLGVIWFGVMLLDTINHEMKHAYTHIVAYQTMRLAAQMAVAIGAMTEATPPERIQKTASGPEWPPVESY